MFRHNMFTHLIATLLVAAFALTGCSDKESMPASPTTPADEQFTVPPEVMNEINELREIAAMPDGGLAYWLSKSDAPPVELPAGSVDALAAAIAAAGPNGTVIVKAGNHTENNTVTITNRVNIIGENGAVLRSGVTPTATVPFVVRPALHVFGAERVKIWNIDFVPTGSVAGTAILLENSPRAIVGNNSMNEFQWSVLLHNSHSSNITGNTIVVNGGWITSALPECDGVININGNDVRMTDNDVSNALLGMFPSGSNGVFLRNNVHGNFIGMVFCKVPAGSFLLPSGAVVGSAVSGNGWHAEGNTATGNFHVGYLVIDGAHNNRLVNNAGSNNGHAGNNFADIELAGETALFGFCTPVCFDNRVIAASHRTIRINDYGLNNRITGGIQFSIPGVPCP